MHDRFLYLFHLTKMMIMKMICEKKKEYQCFSFEEEMLNLKPVWNSHLTSSYSNMTHHDQAYCNKHTLVFLALIYLPQEEVHLNHSETQQDVTSISSPSFQKMSELPMHEFVSL